MRVQSRDICAGNKLSAMRREGKMATAPTHVRMLQKQIAEELR